MVGIVGVGTMGFVSARRLLERDYDVLGYDISPVACQRLKGAGGDVCASLNELGSRCSTVHLFLPTGKEVESCITGGLLTGLKPGGCIIDHSTVAPETSQKMALAAEQRNIYYLDAPILGRPNACGRWTMPVGGDEEACNRCREVLQNLASKIIHVGTHGRGNLIKLMNQLIFSAVNTATAEVFAISDALGCPISELAPLLSGSGAATISPLFKELAQTVLSKSYEQPNFIIDLLAKDARLALDCARHSGIPTFVGDAAQNVTRLAQQRGTGKLDTAAVWKVLKTLNEREK